MTKRLLYLNGMATIGVILNHALAWGYIGLFYWTMRYRPVSVPNFDLMGSADYFGLRFIEQLVTFTIPAFLVVSGYFVAFATRRGQNAPDRKFIVARIRSLVLPYLLWSVIMTLYYHFFEGAAYTPGQIVVNILTGQTTDAFYFIPLLVQFYLLSFLMARLARDHWKMFLVGTALIQGLVQLMRYPLILGMDFPASGALTWLTLGWFFPGNLFWFGAGLVLGFHINEIRPLLERIRWVLLSLWILLLAAGIWEWELLLRLSGQDWLTPKVTLLDNFYSLCFLGIYIGFEKVRLPASHLLNELGTKSFGVYLAHTLAMILTARAVYHFIPAILPHQLIFQPVLIFASLGIPLAMMALLRRSPLRMTYAYIFG